MTGPAHATSGSLASVHALAVTKLFGPTPALRGVSAEFASGTITLLSGPNGAGKSTLLGLLGTRLRATRGRVTYLSAERAEFERGSVRARLGWVSHEPLAYAELTGHENVALVAELQGATTEQVERVAARVELGAFAARPVSTLSRGQRQRVALARALVHEPDLLLLDEPWTGLDVKAARDLERIVEEERARGAIVIVVSHEPGLAERLNASELRLENGRRVDVAARE